jgi:hypothetical protein
MNIQKNQMKLNLMEISKIKRDLKENSRIDHLLNMRNYHKIFSNQRQLYLSRRMDLQKLMMKRIIKIK